MPNQKISRSAQRVFFSDVKFAIVRILTRFSSCGG